MLYDGAIRYSVQARDSLERKDFEAAFEKLTRAQHIILEVMYSLDRGIGDEIYGNLVGLYRFIYMRLVKGNVSREVEPIDEAIKVLIHVRETWNAAIEKAGDELKRGAAGTGIAPAGIPARPQGGGLSIQG